MRRSLFLIGVAAAVVAAPVSASGPEFMPTPSKVYEDYSAIKEPRSDVPVGALWIQGYGPTGDGAAADNLVTVKSLTGVTISRDLQLSLLAGLFSLFGLDPSYKSRVNARFADISIVRVKDMAKLTGPTSEPRIYEALKAGTITISTDSDVGLDLESRAGLKQLPVIGRSDIGSKRSFSIDGRDLFIAIRVATLKKVVGQEEELKVQRKAGAAVAQMGDYEISVDTSKLDQCVCGAASAELKRACGTDKPVTLSIGKAGSASGGSPGQAGIAYDLSKDAGHSVALALPVPVADGEGGLYTSVLARVALDYASSGPPASGEPCVPRLGGKSRVFAALTGSRLEALEHPKSPAW